MNGTFYLREGIITDDSLEYWIFPEDDIARIVVSFVGDDRIIRTVAEFPSCGDAERAYWNSAPPAGSPATMAEIEFAMQEGLVPEPHQNEGGEW